MKKILKKIILCVLPLVVVLCTAALYVSAEAETIISFSNNSPKVNNSVTVTVTVNTTESMYSNTFKVEYNPDVLRFESGDSNGGGAGILSVVKDLNGEKKISYSFKFTAIAAGKSQISVNGGAYTMNSDEVIGASATMTVSDASKSDNANLKSLSLSNGKLSPSFSASRTSYTATVANSVTQCRVYATASDSGAKVSVSGDSALKVGKNTRTVTVTAPSGAQKTYTITITRLAENEEPTDSSDTDTSGTESTEEPTGNPLGGRYAA